MNLNEFLTSHNTDLDGNCKRADVEDDFMRNKHRRNTFRGIEHALSHQSTLLLIGVGILDINLAGIAADYERKRLIWQLEDEVRGDN